MALRDDLLARARDPWFALAAGFAFVFPAVFAIGAAFERGSWPDAYLLLVASAAPSTSVLPLLVLLLVAASPTNATRRDALRAFGLDVALVTGAFVLGWGVPALVAAATIGVDATALAAFVLIVAQTALLLAAWRALAGAVDAPGLETSPLLRRLLVLHVGLGWIVPLLPRYLRANPLELTTASVLAEALSPEATHRLLVELTFPSVGFAGSALGRDALGAWYAPWTFALVLALWVVVPLAIMAAKYPRAAAPPPPPDAESATP